MASGRKRDWRLNIYDELLDNVRRLVADYRGYVPEHQEEILEEELLNTGLSKPMTKRFITKAIRAAIKEYDKGELGRYESPSYEGYRESFAEENPEDDESERVFSAESRYGWHKDKKLELLKESVKLFLHGLHPFTFEGAGGEWDSIMIPFQYKQQIGNRGEWWEFKLLRVRAEEGAISLICYCSDYEVARNGEFQIELIRKRQ